MLEKNFKITTLLKKIETKNNDLKIAATIALIIHSLADLKSANGFFSSGYDNLQLKNDPETRINQILNETNNWMNKN